jgi:tetratricopeptide (TPR) repeat protein
VDLLGQFGILLERFTVEPTALLMVRGNFGQRLWYRWSISRALNYLIEAERILSPRDGQIEAKGRQVEAGEYVRPLSRKVLKLTDKYPQSMLGSLFIFGWQLSNLNRPKEALACFNKIISFVSEIEILSASWGMRGIALDELGRYEEAIASYDQALQFKPDKDEAWDSRGLALMYLGHYQEALNSYERALRLKPDAPNPLYNKACCYALQNNVDLTVENLERAISLNPEYREMAKTDSNFDSIREDERFQKLIQE